MTHASGLRTLPERVLRSGLLTLSRRRVLGRIATRLPVARDMVGRFVAGQTFEEALPALETLHARGFATTVDILGESVTSIEHADEAVAAYLATLDALAAAGVDRNVSLKLTQMGLKVDPARCRANVARIVERAVELAAFVRIDMEDHTTVDATLDLWRAVRPPPADRGTAPFSGPDVGVVIQSALHRSHADVEALIAEGARVRLCKGAYQEPAAVAHQDRADVDAAYRDLMAALLTRGASPALATHDPALIRAAAEIAREHDIPRDRFEFQMLYGIRRDLQERLLHAGFRVRIYVPFGREWYPYFMRRLAERPQNVTFLLRTVMGEGRHGR